MGVVYFDRYGARARATGLFDAAARSQPHAPKSKWCGAARSTIQSLHTHTHRTTSSIEFCGNLYTNAANGDAHFFFGRRVYGIDVLLLAAAAAATEAHKSLFIFSLINFYYLQQL